MGQQAASASSTFSHITSDGNITMVDVGAKTSTQRHAVAEAVVKFPDSRTYQSYFDITNKKGDARLCSKIAGILAAKVRQRPSFPTVHVSLIFVAYIRLNSTLPSTSTFTR
jgi:cyclic pyranopterin phosphate synthase